MENDFLKDLNPQQQKAVKDTIGAQIILAGAGSGKTRVLTYKVIYLLKEKNINPAKILNVSFRDFKPSSILATISQAKNQLINFSDYRNYARGFFQETVADIYPVYQKILKENNALDFDDLILETVS